jgi:flavin reductase (DIM6/NTAB) family NADH-FMN oxidoreductase RutF
MSDEPEADAKLADAFRTAMRRIAATVTIVSVADDRSKSGMTATAVSSVSADPPALLVCINRSAGTHAKMRQGKAFCVNVLGVDHAPLSVAFGGKLLPEERFSLGTWHADESGVPYLHDAQANIFCTVDAALDYGTHTIFVGKVRAIRLFGDVSPLIYGNGRFIGA